MGCHNSKQARRDLILILSPLPRSKSLPEKAHLVSLTSSTLGSLSLHTKEDRDRKENNGADGRMEQEIPNARAWSNVIDRRVPKTPTETPPNEPESIDALELMAGLHGDYSPLHRRSFSFCHIGHFGKVNDSTPSSSSTSSSLSSSCNGDTKKGNIVLFYFTSLRGVRKTYDDCCLVKEILKEYNVHVDERDVSMHGRFKEELKEKMSENGCFTLPRVFVGERDLGGAEEVKRMHENGELWKVFEGCVIDLRGKEEPWEGCEACGDVRFVMCARCSGSCRVYVEADEEEISGSGRGRGWQLCSDCNENGIVKCSVCG